MRLALTLAATAVLAAAGIGAAHAQAPAPDVEMFATGPEVQTLIANARAKYDPKSAASFSQTIVKAAPYEVTLDYRTHGGTSSLHEKQAELIFVMEGKMTFVIGGTMVEPKNTNADNFAGTGIKGGVPRQMAKGDWVMVPQNTPHWISATEGELILIALHMPRG
jgi:hypothetical protein